MRYYYTNFVCKNGFSSSSVERYLHFFNCHMVTLAYTIINGRQENFVSFFFIFLWTIVH